MITRTICKWLVMILCSLLAACAIITVNVYFPEKDVKQAYKSLDDMLLKQEGVPVSPETEKLPAGGEKKENQTHSWLKNISFSLVGAACAEESVADRLAVEIADMPDVLKAYSEMKERLPLINSLRESGAIGENKQGLVSVRDKDKLGDKQQIIDAENSNRKAIITGMARAILKLDKKQDNSANLNKVLGKAAATYASTKQEEAKTGWWIELQNGRWVQK